MVRRLGARLWRSGDTRSIRRRWPWLVGLVVAGTRREWGLLLRRLAVACGHVGLRACGHVGLPWQGFQVYR